MSSYSIMSEAMEAYNEWKTDPTNPACVERLCEIITINDLLAWYGHGIETRHQAEIFLRENPSYKCVIRNSSIRDTDSCKYVAVSYRHADIVYHTLCGKIISEDVAKKNVFVEFASERTISEPFNTDLRNKTYDTVGDFMVTHAVYFL